MKKKKITGILAFILSAGLLLTGCGNSAGQAGNAGSTQASSQAGGQDTASAADSTDAAAGTGAGSTDAGAANADESGNAGGNGKTITYALGSSWNSLNPFNTGGYFYATQVVSKIFDTLAYVDSNMEIQPRAASSWEAEDDGNTLVFHLNENSTWQDDGSPVTAQDWVFTLKLISNPLTDVTSKSRLNVVTGTDGNGNTLEGEELGVEARDDYTLVFHLKEPSYPDAFIRSAARYYLYVLPEHLLRDTAPEDLAGSDFWNHPVGSGPFEFVSENAGNELTLRAYQDYYLGAPQFDTLVYRVIDPSNMVTSMAAGEIDACYPSISVDEALAIDGVYDNVVVQEDKVNSTMYTLSINNEKFDEKVRQAINYSIDKQLLVDQLALGHGAVATTYLDSSSPYHNDEVTFTRDVEKAKELLAEDGWDSSTVIKLAVPSGTRERIAAILQANLAEAGITLEINTVDGTTMFSGFSDGTYDAVITSSVPVDPLNGIGQLSTDASWAGRPTTNQYYDELVAVRSEMDETKRAELINEAQADQAEGVPAIPLYEEYTQDIRSARVSGITTVGTDAPWTWTVKD